MHISLPLLCPFSPFPGAVMWRAELHKNSLETALKEEATARKEEAVTLHQEVASLQMKLENTEKEIKDVLVRVADAMKSHFGASFGAFSC